MFFVQLILNICYSSSDLIETADIGDFIDLSCFREETSMKIAVEEELRMRRERDAARIVKQQFAIQLDSLELDESFFTKIKQMFSVTVHKDIQAEETRYSREQWLSATGKHDDVQKAQVIYIVLFFQLSFGMKSDVSKIKYS